MNIYCIYAPLYAYLFPCPGPLSGFFPDLSLDLVCFYMHFKCIKLLDYAFI